MKVFIRKMAKTIRHHPLLRKNDFLWDLFRKPYHKLLNLGGSGTPLKIAENLTIRIPAEYLSSDLENYEKENVEKLVRWVHANPKSLLLDIGSSMGIMSAIALNVSDEIHVIAFDSDLNSLKATKAMCQFAKGKNLNVVYGFITEKSRNNLSLLDISSNTEKIIRSSRTKSLPKFLKYVNIHTNKDTTIPEYAIDTIFYTENINSRVLIKCDIEGAELLALNGARKFIQRYGPDMLLSVHPLILPEFGKSVQDVSSFLEEVGYGYEIIAIDHEEHWWCQKISK